MILSVYFDPRYMLDTLLEKFVGDVCWTHFETFVGEVCWTLLEKFAGVCWALFEKFVGFVGDFLRSLLETF